MFVRIMFILVVIGSFVLAGCVEEPVASLYSDEFAAAPTPQIAGISSTSGVFLAGITPATITGSNFSPFTYRNYVYFDTARATVLQASSTQLVVTAPYFAIQKDSSRRAVVRVAVIGSERFDSTLCTLQPSVASVGRIGANEEALGMATDAAGNLYAGILLNSINGQIIRVSAADNRRDTMTTTVAQRRYIAMKVGPGGYLYMLNEGTAAILRMTLTPGAPGPYGAVAGITDLSDFDFDASLNIWIGSKSAANTKVARMNPSRQVRTFPFTGVIRAVRVFDGYLYLGGKADTVEGVWRAQIVSADSLSPFQKYLDIRTLTGVDCQVRSLTFSSDGYAYVGTSAPNGIYVVAPGGGSATPLYPPIIGTPIHAMAWGNGPALFASKRATPPKSDFYFINTEKTSAPYYGR